MVIPFDRCKCREGRKSRKLFGLIKNGLFLMIIPKTVLSFCWLEDAIFSIFKPHSCSDQTLPTLTSTTKKMPFFSIFLFMPENEKQEKIKPKGTETPTTSAKSIEPPRGNFLASLNHILAFPKFCPSTNTFKEDITSTEPTNIESEVKLIN